MAISNLLKPNPTLPNIIKSYAPKQQGLVPTLPAGPQSMIPTPKPAVSTAQQNKDYANFTDADWLQYQANKPKPVVKQAPVQNNAVADNSMGTANQNANFFGQYNQAPQQQAPKPQAQPRGLFPDVVSSLYKTATDTKEVDKANQDLLNLRKQYSTAVGNIESTPIPLEFQQGRSQVLGRQYASQEAAAQSALSNALTARGQNISALGSAAGLAAPRSADLLVDPTTGQPIGDINKMGSALANWSSIRSGANTAGQFTADYQEGLANLRAADTIFEQIKNTISSNPTINSQPLSAWTNIKQLLSAQFSDPAQQQLAMQVRQYIQTLGLDSNTVMNIESQQQGTLAQLLDSLRAQAGAQIESKNPQNVINNPQGTNPVQAGGGQVINTAVGPVDNAWF